MASTDRPLAYRKFTGQRGSIASVEQLWAGEDHLLQVRSSFAVERYRRFYFRDIEAFIIRPTNTQRSWLIADAIGLAICGGLAALAYSQRTKGASDPDGMAVFWGILAAIFLIALLYQLIRGPSCLTFLQMRTGLERIRSANRIRASLKMRIRLATLIATAAEAAAAAPFMP